MKRHTYRTRPPPETPRILLERELPRELRARERPNNAAEYSEHPGALRRRMNARARARALDAPGEPARSEAPALTEGAGVVARSQCVADLEARGAAGKRAGEGEP